MTASKVSGPDISRFPFLHDSYSGADLDPTAHGLKKGLDASLLGLEVATRLIELMEEDPAREFPLLHIADPTRTILIPVLVHPSSYDEVTTTNLLRESETLVDGREGAFDIQSPYEEASGPYRSLGSIRVTRAPQPAGRPSAKPYVERLSLDRPGQSPQETFHNIGGAAREEQVAFFGLVNRYLDDLR